MDNNLNKIRKKISENEIVLGTIISFSDPVVSEVLCNCGFDFIWIDGEHQPLDKKDIDLHIMTVKGAGSAPLVRISWNDPVRVKPILEMGPAGIIFPFIKTKEEAELAVASCKYPPKGIRGYGPRRANRFSAMSKEEYIEKAKTEPWIILIIEHIEAVNNLEEIVKVEGVDSIVVGPEDLSGSIGLLGQTRHPDVIKLLDKIAGICCDTGIPFGAGVSTLNQDDINDWINRGVNWLLLDNDYSSLYFYGKKSYEDTKRLFDINKQKKLGIHEKYFSNSEQFGNGNNIIKKADLDLIVKEIMERLKKEFKYRT